MITSQDFDRVIYPNPEKQLKAKKLPLSKIIGLDSEAYTDGTPFMFATSNGDIFTAEDIPHCLFTLDYVQANFTLYNMKYDSGALLYHLPKQNLFELWETGRTEYSYSTKSYADDDQNIWSFKYRYIPHKMLRITSGKASITFWDIAQYFKSSLNYAAKKYLDKEKLDIPTKKFTRKYVARFWKAIAKYCIQDAKLTQELSVYVIDKLKSFDLNPSALYSSASISYSYFLKNSRIVTSWRFWNDSPDVLKFACDAYEGGKFEVTQRGYFPQLHEYDITSAYPYEISNLVDISNAVVHRSPDYQKDAVYGFLRVLIDNPESVHLPCGPMVNGVRIYPNGSYYLTITKQEYDYIKTLSQIHIEILDAIWLFVDKIVYPYRDPIMHLFAIKDRYKKTDPMLYTIIKINMNGWYGKLVQAIEDHEKRIHVGAAWNPVYGAVITANTRLQVTKIQNLMRDDCVAVHTDSVMLKRPLPSSVELNGLGKFEFVEKGAAVIIACGMYQINEVCACKGFKPKKKTKDHYETWVDILNKYPHRSRIPYSMVKPQSWVETMAKNHDKSQINVFTRFPKVIDLNCDVKRVWDYKLKAKEFLSHTQIGSPKIVVHFNKPKYW
jgi:hypothetical protein